MICFYYETYCTKEKLEIDILHKDLEDYCKTFEQQVVEMLERNLTVAKIEALDLHN